MRQLLGIVLAFGALLGMTALAVERFHDRELFVSPPDVVAENFARAVVNGRYAPARAYLATPVSEEELRALRESLGDPSGVEAKVVSREDSRALVTVNGVRFRLVFDREWKVALR